MLRAIVLVVCALAPLAALAQERAPSSAERAAARELYEEGVRAARERRWEEARDAFARSYQIFAHPMTLMNLAGALSSTGRLASAADAYRSFLAQAGPDERRLYGDAAQRALAEIEPRVPRLTIRASLAESDALAIDGEVMSAALIGTPIPLDPGERAIEVRRGDRVVAQRTIALAEGAREEIALAVPAIDLSPEQAARAVVGEPDVAPPPSDESGIFIAIGVSAAVLVLGAVATVLAFVLMPPGAPSGNQDPLAVP